jgi:hypothetical protein
MATRQRARTIVKPVKLDPASVSVEVDALEEKLRQIGDVVQWAMRNREHACLRDDETEQECINRIIRQMQIDGVFDAISGSRESALRSHLKYLTILRLDTLHYLSVTLVHKPGASEADILLEVTFDGGAGKFFRDMATECQGLLQSVFEDCESWTEVESGEKPLWKWLLEKNHPWGVFYFGNTGRTVTQIREERALRESVVGIARRRDTEVNSRLELWECIKADLTPEQKRLVDEIPPRPWWAMVFRKDTYRVFINCVSLALKASFWVIGLTSVYAHLKELDPVQILPFLPEGSLLYGHFEAAVFAVAGPVLILLIALGYWRSLIPKTPRVSWKITFELKSVGKSAWFGLNLSALVGLVMIFYWALSVIPWPAVFLIMLYVALGLVTLVLGLFAILFAWQLAPSFLILVGILLLVMTRCLVHLSDNVAYFFSYWALAAIFLYLIPLGVLWRNLYKLRQLESTGTVAYPELKGGKLNILRRRDTEQMQSHLVAVFDRKDDALILKNMKFVFLGLQLAHYLYFNKGWLGSISTIHSARWVKLGGDRYIFYANYDFSFAGYLGLFADQEGTTAVFGHAEGFPRPYMLMWDGARSEQMFKDYARDKQKESLIWYSAYPDLTVMDIERASRLRIALGRSVDSVNTRAMTIFRRAFHRAPLDEAEISEIIRVDLKAGT